MGRLVLVEHSTGYWRAFMTEEDAKKFVAAFPNGSFKITMIQVKSVESAIQSWNNFIEDL